jgi:putative hemolysin
MNNIWLMLLVQLVLIALNAVFACAEIAVISVNDTKLEYMAEQGNKRAQRLQKLKGQPARFLATIQVAITLSGFLGSAFAADNFSDSLVSFLVGTGIPIPRETLDTISVVLITLILSYVTLVLGELVPKRLAMRKAERVALAMSNLIYVIAKLFTPIVSLLTLSNNGVLRLLGINPNEADSEEVSEEDIKLMVDAGSKTGAIDEEEKELIQNIFAFDDLTAGEIVTHRTDVQVLWLDESPEEWDAVIRDSAHSFYPVCGETVDEVVGVLNTRDYFKLQSNNRDDILAYAISDAYYVPEGVKADVLFRKMKEEQQRFAVVLDEYGGMLGVITVLDLVERLVGDMGHSDDEEKETPDIEALQTEDGEPYWMIKGTTLIEAVEQALGVELGEDCDTFGGYVFNAIGSIPEEGSSPELTVGRLHIRVTNVAEHQMVSAMVQLVKEEAEDEKE